MKILFLHGWKSVPGGVKPTYLKYGTAKTVKPGTAILHSRADDVIPFADSEELAKNCGATLIEVGTDHRLADPEPLERMLRECCR